MSELQTWLLSFVREQGFLARYPYYAHVLAALTPVADPSVPLMGVSLHGVPGQGGRYYLHVNIDALMREPQYLRGLLLHEVHHVVLGHLALAKFFPERETSKFFPARETSNFFPERESSQPGLGMESRELMLIAQEMSANEHIDEALPSPVIWQHFERFGVRAGQSTMERYRLLLAARSEGEEPMPKEGTKPVDKHEWNEQSAPTPGGMQGTRELLERLRDEDDASADKVQKPEVRRIAGHTPEELLVMLSNTSEAPEVYINWREALRTFVARARAPVHTWSRPSRRFPGRIGEIPGRSYLPRTVLRPTILVAIDTSLSMTESELGEIAKQLRPMSEEAQLVIAECDAQITRTYPWRGAITSVKGRGGTDLRPVFQPNVLMRHGVDGVVYFTDGDGPFPDREPRVPVLWMLTKPSDFACPWGDRALLVRPHAKKR